MAPASQLVAPSLAGRSRSPASRAPAGRAGWRHATGKSKVRTRRDQGRVASTSVSVSPPKSERPRQLCARRTRERVAPRRGGRGCPTSGEHERGHRLAAVREHGGVPPRRGARRAPLARCSSSSSGRAPTSRSARGGLAGPSVARRAPPPLHDGPHPAGAARGGRGPLPARRARQVGARQQVARDARDHDGRLRAGRMASTRVVTAGAIGWSGRRTSSRACHSSHCTPHVLRGSRASRRARRSNREGCTGRDVIAVACLRRSAARRDAHACPSGRAVASAAARR